MRRLILTMLLATSMATPALAQRGDREGGWNRDRGGERSRPERTGSRAEMAAPQAQVAPQSQRVMVSRGAPSDATMPGQTVVERSRGGWNNGGNWNNGVGRGIGSGFEGRTPRSIDPATASRWEGRRGRDSGATATPVVDRTSTVAPSGRTTDWRGRTRTVDGTNSGWTRTPDGRTTPVVGDGDRRTRDGRWTGTRDGRTNDGRWRDGRSGDSRWTSDWRRDRRYDWRDYRRRNSSIFRLGRYYDPFGYGYQRLSIGFNLFPGYYQSNYWLSDPYQYRLPPAYGPYRWVRYYDDAVLVDIYTGEVVDVIQGFFW